MIRRWCYDFEILYNKWSPFIIAPLILIYHISQFITPFDVTWLQYLCLPSLMTIIHMYNSRITFKLCKVHKCLVNYVAINSILCIIEHYFITKELKLIWFILMLFIALCTMIITLYYYEKSNSKTSKIESSRD